MPADITFTFPMNRWYFFKYKAPSSHKFIATDFSDEKCCFSISMGRALQITGSRTDTSDAAMGILKFKEKRTINLYKNTSGSRVKEDFSVGNIFDQIG